MEIIEVIMSFLLLLTGLVGFDVDSEEQGIKVGSFNAQIFGDSKLEKVGVDYYVQLAREYDVLFLLEIRDADGSSFDSVCEELGNYNYSCLVSNRSGRSSSKEQVGMIYRDSIGVLDYGEVDDLEDDFEREPFWVEFNFSDDRFYVLHLKPDDVSREMSALEIAISREPLVVSEGVVLIGDLNADCSYYDNLVETQFDSWDWLIGDYVDTTTGKTDCAYDRIIVSDGVLVLRSGVVGIDSEVSDHNLVWVKLAVSY